MGQQRLSPDQALFLQEAFQKFGGVMQERQEQAPDWLKQITELQMSGPVQSVGMLAGGGPVVGGTSGFRQAAKSLLRKDKLELLKKGDVPLNQEAINHSLKSHKAVREALDTATDFIEQQKTLGQTPTSMAVEMKANAEKALVSIQRSVDMVSTPEAILLQTQLADDAWNFARAVPFGSDIYKSVTRQDFKGIAMDLILKQMKKVP